MLFFLSCLDFPGPKGMSTEKGDFAVACADLCQAYLRRRRQTA